jgi:hypothetical protein
MDSRQDYSIVAHPGPGYYFSEWQVEGGVQVNELSEATTFAWVEDDGEDGRVLTMVQTSPTPTITPTPTVTPTIPPIPTDVPTMSQWGMIGMAIVLAAALVWSIRKRWVVRTDKS